MFFKIKNVRTYIKSHILLIDLQMKNNRTGERNRPYDDGILDTLVEELSYWKDLLILVTGKKKENG